MQKEKLRRLPQLRLILSPITEAFGVDVLCFDGREVRRAFWKTFRRKQCFSVWPRDAAYFLKNILTIRMLFSSVVTTRGVLSGEHLDNKDVFQVGRVGQRAF